MNPSVIVLGTPEVLHVPATQDALITHFGLARVTDLDSDRARWFTEGGELGITTNKQCAAELARGLGIQSMSEYDALALISFQSLTETTSTIRTPTAATPQPAGTNHVFTRGCTEALKSPEPRFVIPPPSADAILRNAAAAIEQRATQRDQPAGERSMARTVAAFNALTGTEVTERDGWLFMAILKAARATAGAHTLDDYVDGAAYFGLAGECAERAA